MGIQSIIRWLIPRDDAFFEMMERQAAIMHDASLALARLGGSTESPQEVNGAVLELEHQGDKVLHDLETALAATFVTPIDREDIHHLATRLDDVLDYAKAASQAYSLYDIKKPSPAMLELIDLLGKATGILRDALPRLRKHQYAAIRDHKRELSEVEKDADRTFRAAVGELFRNPSIDTKELLREKEVLERLEHAVNACEGVADVLSNLAVKHG